MDIKKVLRLFLIISIFIITANSVLAKVDNKLISQDHSIIKHKVTLELTNLEDTNWFPFIFNVTGQSIGFEVINPKIEIERTRYYDKEVYEEFEVQVNCFNPNSTLKNETGLDNVCHKTDYNLTGYKKASEKYWEDVGVIPSKVNLATKEEYVKLSNEYWLWSGVTYKVRVSWEVPLNKYTRGSIGEWGINPDDWWNTTWNFCRNVTIENNVGSTLTNFPVLVNITNTENMSSDLRDLRFTSNVCDSGGTELDYEIDTIQGNSALIWLRIPSFTSGDNDVGMYYNATGVGVGENPTGVWDEFFLFVYHMDLNSSTSVNDSTSNANHGLITGDGVIATDCNIGKCLLFYGSGSGNNDYLKTMNNVDLDGAVPATFEAWANETGVDNYDTIFGTKDYYRICIETSNWKVIAGGSGNWDTGVGGDTNLNYHSVAYDGTRHFWLLNSNQYNATVGLDRGNTGVWIGVDGNTGDSWYWEGTIEEARVSNESRSLAWRNMSFQIVDSQSDLVTIYNQVNSVPPDNTPITNTPTIIPDPAYSNSNLNCSTIAFDDLDISLTMEFSWLHDGTYNATFSTNVSTTNGTITYTTILVSSGLVVGENWTCSVKTSDNNSYGVANTTTIQISNTMSTWVENPTDFTVVYPVDISYDLNATDIDGSQTLNYYINNSDFDINLTTGLINRTTLTGDIGYYYVNVNVTDSVDWINASFIINISNNPPTWVEVATDQRYIHHASNISYDLNATDIDAGQTLTYYINATDFDIDSSTGLINRTITGTDYGNYSINVNVTDSIVWISTSFNIEIMNITQANLTPQMVSATILPATPQTNDTLYLYCQASDGNLDDLSYNWKVFKDGVIVSNDTTNKLYGLRMETATQTLLTNWADYTQVVDNNYSSYSTPLGADGYYYFNYTVPFGYDLTKLDSLIDYRPSSFARKNLSITDTCKIDSRTLELWLSSSLSTNVVNLYCINETSNWHLIEKNTGTNKRLYEEALYIYGRTNHTQNTEIGLDTFNINVSDLNAVFQLECTASDGWNTSTPLNSSSITILNTPPTIDSLGLTTDGNNLTTANITASYSCSDLEGDTCNAYVAYKWYNGSVIIAGQTTNILLSNYTVKGDNIMLELTLEDDSGYANNRTALNTSVLIILNSQPIITSVSIVTPLYSHQTAECIAVETDDDLDTTAIYYKWFNDTSLISGQVTENLTNTYFLARHNLTCEATANDGTINSTPLNSSSVRVLPPLSINITLIDENTNASLNLNNVTQAKLYYGNNTASYDFKDENETAYNFSHLPHSKISLELEYSDGSRITRYFDTHLIDTENFTLRICANAEGNTHYEQLITSSTERAVLLLNTFANCYVAADYTRFAYENTQVLKAYTLNKIYTLTVYDNDGNQIDLANIDGTIASYINIDTLLFYRDQNSIDFTTSTLSMEQTNSNETTLYYYNQEGDNTGLDIEITRMDTSAVVYSSSSYTNPNEATIVFNYASLSNLTNTTLFRVEVTETRGGLVTTFYKYFNTEGGIGTVPSVLIAFVSIFLLVFGLSFTIAANTFGWFGVFMQIVNLAILTMAISVWYIQFLMAINVIVLIYIILVLTAKNQATIG